MPSVLKSWIPGLPFRMQSVLMAAIRGCDIAKKHDHSKFITRGIRSLVLTNADPTNTFIVDGFPATEHVMGFLDDIDSYPMHFIAHTMHAAEIIGYKHPSEVTRDQWFHLYSLLVQSLHLNPETEAQLDVRLGKTPAETEVKTTKWNAGTGTSHDKSYL